MHMPMPPARCSNVWLSNSTPFRKLIDNAMAQALAGLSMPSRDNVTRLAERLTNIEMRLDDLDAKLDAIPRAAQSGGFRQVDQVREWENQP